MVGEGGGGGGTDGRVKEEAGSRVTRFCPSIRGGEGWTGGGEGESVRDKRRGVGKREIENRSEGERH